MPKLSMKRKYLRQYEQTALAKIRALDDEPDNPENRKKKQDIKDDVEVMRKAINASRYVFFKPNSTPKSLSFYNNLLENYDECEFKQLVRMGRPAFYKILDLIKEDDVFHGKASSRQIPTERQLLIVLYRLGVFGEEATNGKIGKRFGIGVGGTLRNISKRVFAAIKNLRAKYLYWPKESERKKLAEESMYEMPNCIGYISGTGIRLAEKPLEDPENYFSSEYNYSLKIQMVCDHKLRIRHCLLGYPGSYDDSSLYSKSIFGINPNLVLSGDEYIIGDSAYKLTTTLITPFKAGNYHNDVTLEQREEFNRIHNVYRTRIQECFALLKGRFSSLKELKVQISDESSIKECNDWILVCAILHNILIEQKDYFPLPDEEEKEDYNDEDCLECETSTDIVENSRGEEKRIDILRQILKC